MYAIQIRHNQLNIFDCCKLHPSLDPALCILGLDAFLVLPAGKLFFQVCFGLCNLGLKATFGLLETGDALDDAFEVLFFGCAHVLSLVFCG